MDVLKNLTFCSGRISDQKNVDFSSESSSARLCEGLVGASKKLAKHSFFHVSLLPD